MTVDKDTCNTNEWFNDRVTNTTMCTMYDEGRNDTCLVRSIEHVLFFVYYYLFDKIYEGIVLLGILT